MKPLTVTTISRDRRSHSGLSAFLIVATTMSAVAAPPVRAGDGSAAGGHGVTVFQRSVYTTIDLPTCSRTKTSDGESHICKGLPGYPIYMAEGDLRAFIAASTAPAKSRAAEQTLKAFNTPFKGNATRAPIEWRIVIREGKQVPYAAIIKYYTKNDEAQGQVFVVMKIAGAETCHVAYIDAVANPEAIILARQVADEKARNFNCKEPPAIVGARGKSPM